MRRLETRIFRIDHELSEQVNELAQKDKFGLVTISKGLLKTFFSLMSDEQARTIGHENRRT